MAPLARTSRVNDGAAYLAEHQVLAAKTAGSLIMPLLPNEDPEDDSDLPRAQTAPTIQKPPTDPCDRFDRTISEPSCTPRRRYVAYRANPFRVDLRGRGTAMLPRKLQAHLEEKLGDRAGLALCSVTRDEEVMSEAEFHEVMERVQEEVDKAEGPVDSYWDTLMALMSALVVNPLVVMPYYTSLNGALVSFLILGAVGAVSMRCAAGLNACVDELAMSMPVSEAPLLARDYAFIAHYALGRAGSAVATAIYTVDYGTAVVANFVMVDSLYRDWLPALSAMGRWLPLLGHAVLTCVLLYVPSTVFNKTQLLASTSSFVLVVTLTVLAVSRIAIGDVDMWALLYPRASVDSIILEVTSAIFAFGNTSLVPKVTSSWQSRPRERDSLLRTSFAASTGIYTAFGAVGTLALGRCGPDAIFAMKGPLGLLSQICFLMRIQFCLPLLCSPVIHVMQDMVGVAQKKRQRVILSLALVFASVLLAKAAGGQIDTVMSLIGACVTTSLILVLPPLMELNLCGGMMDHRARGRLLAIAGCGSVCALAGTAAAWRRLTAV